VADADARIIDQHIHATHQAHGIGKSGLHLVQVGDVGVHRSSQLRQLRLDLLAAFGIAIEHDDGCAFFEKAAAVAAPIPLAPPVIRTRLFLSPRIGIPW